MNEELNEEFFDRYSVGVPYGGVRRSLFVGVTDLQFRLRFSHCNRRGDFRITIFDERSRGDNSKSRLERVVVAGE